MLLRGTALFWPTVHCFRCYWSCRRGERETRRWAGGGDCGNDGAEHLLRQDGSDAPERRELGRQPPDPPPPGQALLLPPTRLSS